MKMTVYVIDYHDHKYRDVGFRADAFMNEKNAQAEADRLNVDEDNYEYHYEVKKVYVYAGR